MSNKRVNPFKVKIHLLECEVEEKDLKIADLEVKLAEKEKEIDNLYNRLNSKQKFYEMGLEKDYKEYLSRLNKIKKRTQQRQNLFCSRAVGESERNFNTKC